MRPACPHSPFPPQIGSVAPRQKVRPCMPQDCGQLLRFHPALQGVDSEGMPQILQPDMIYPRLLQDFVVKSADHRPGIRLPCARMREHQRVVGVFLMFCLQQLYCLIY